MEPLIHWILGEIAIEGLSGSFFSAASVHLLTLCRDCTLFSVGKDSGLQSSHDGRFCQGCVLMQSSSLSSRGTQLASGTPFARDATSPFTRSQARMYPLLLGVASVIMSLTLVAQKPAISQQPKEDHTRGFLIY